MPRLAATYRAGAHDPHHILQNPQHILQKFGRCTRFFRTRVINDFDLHTSLKVYGQQIKKHPRFCSGNVPVVWFTHVPQYTFDLK